MVMELPVGGADGLALEAEADGLALAAEADVLVLDAGRAAAPARWMAVLCGSVTTVIDRLFLPGRM